METTQPIPSHKPQPLTPSRTTVLYKNLCLYHQAFLVKHHSSAQPLHRQHETRDRGKVKPKTNMALVCMQMLLLDALRKHERQELIAGPRYDPVCFIITPRSHNERALPLVFAWLGRHRRTPIAREVRHKDNTPVSCDDFLVRYRTLLLPRSSHVIRGYSFPPLSLTATITYVRFGISPGGLKASLHWE